MKLNVRLIHYIRVTDPVTALARVSLVQAPFRDGCSGEADDDRTIATGDTTFGRTVRGN
jgi:hypothetical protein